MSPPSQLDDAPPVVFGCVLLGGSLTGALVRDVRLANELSRRGYPVHVWWAMDRSRSAGLRPQINEHWLFHGLRFWPKSSFGRGAMEGLGRGLNRVFPDARRAHGLQRRPELLRRLMENLMQCLCDGVDRERAVVHRFARDLEETGVTHVLPMLEMLCPWVAAARRHMQRRIQYLVTFQGYELYSTYARSIDRLEQFHSRLIETVDESDWPAIAVSEDYLERVVEEVGVARQKLCAIPPGVPPAGPMAIAKARELVKSKFQEYRAETPLVTYLGRRDVEKGIDILLYAAAILKRRGVRFQLAICGPSLWGDHYGRVCQQIAEELRLDGTVMWRRFVPDEVRTALFCLSTCIVYPSIHREPFGMVAAEAVAHGTPAIVPDYGGVASAIAANGETAGLRFNAWDSGDLAAQINRLLSDPALREQLRDAGPRVAEHFSIENLADRVLAHLGIGVVEPRPHIAACASS